MAIILGGGIAMRFIVGSLLALVLLGALTALGTGRVDAQQSSCNPAVQAC
jgi:ABC-type arginine transport system permease subunit